MANDDLISRQAAIGALDGELTITGRENAETIRDYINGVDKKLRELPSAERRGRWIPVTERLPAYGEEVLLSMNGDCGIGYLVPTYDERRYEWHHLGCFYDFNEVDAWMPLPGTIQRR